MLHQPEPSPAHIRMLILRHPRRKQTPRGPALIFRYPAPAISTAATPGKPCNSACSSCRDRPRSLLQPLRQLERVSAAPARRTRSSAWLLHAASVSISTSYFTRSGSAVSALKGSARRMRYTNSQSLSKLVIPQRRGGTCFWLFWVARFIAHLRWVGHRRAVKGPLLKPDCKSSSITAKQSLHAQGQQQ